jgi:outer membrane protein OmpA-like peptidoglycan-associated protein
LRSFIIIIFSLIFFSESINAQLVIDKYDQVDQTAFINKISIDDNNFIWVCTSNGIFKIGNIESAPKHLLAGKDIKCITHDSKLGTFASDSYKLYNLKNGSSFSLPVDNAIINDVDIVKGAMYVATNKGLHILNPRTARGDYLNERNSKLKSDYINFVHEDANKVIWLGTKSGEVRIKGDKWKTYHHDFNVTDYYENKEGLWFIGDGEMWLVDYYNREYNAGLNAELYAGNLNDFVIDSDGRLYVASNKLVRYDPYNETTKVYSADAGLLSKKCTSIACDKNNNIWIGTGGTGLYRLVFGEVAEVNEVYSAFCIIEKGISCSGKKDAVVKVSVSGGQSPYTYKWNDNLLSGLNPKNIGPGDYAVSVTDANGEEIISEVSISSPNPITMDLVSMTRVSGPNKKDGELLVEAKGGSGSFKYSWSNGKRRPSNKNLRSGEYTLTITDNNKCKAIASFQVQKEKFIPELDMTSIEVGKTLRINELKFTADSTDVMDSSFEVLEEILEFLNINPTVIVEIGGHTNTLPSDSYCDQLSEERARSVAEYFYNNGVSNKRLSYKGYGKRKPLTKDESLKGRQKNQRVEIKVLAI